MSRQDEVTTGEWGDAVAAIHGYPGAPSAEAVERLVAVGDRLLLALRDREEQHRELRAELESATERHAYHLETAERLAHLTGLVREWQEARKPAALAAPGEFLAETFQAAVRRMSAADEALAACRLDVAEAETPAAGKRAQTPNEAEMLRALSDALTGGNASTWEQVLHAAERLRDESTLLNEWIPGDPVGMNEQPRHHPSLRDELAEIIRWRFRTADGEIMDGVTMLKAAQEIADAIAPMIEEATGGR